MAHDPTDLVLGRGEVYFDLFALGTRVGSGERYLGNTPSFQISRVTERAQRFRSYGGKKVEIEGVVTAEAHSLMFITDNISMENVALWYGTQPEMVAQAAGAAIIEPFAVTPGRFIQLGKTVTPFGLRNVANVVIRIGASVVAMLDNYEVDPTMGRIKILTGPAFEGATNITVEFARGVAVTKQAKSKPVERFGAVTFISKNAYGPRKNVFLPYVRLSSRGQVDLKGDEWQQMPFEATVLKLNSITEQVYIDEMVV